MSHLTSQEIRAKLNHPIVDADGHTVEINEVFLDYLAQVAGPEEVKTYRAWQSADSPRPLDAWYRASPAERQRQRIHRPAFWVPTGKTADRAVSMLPDLRRQRMEEIGIDFSILYPTMFGARGAEPNDDMRVAISRTISTMQADLYADHADRMTPAAVIPMHTPEEGLRELEYATGTLGLKVIQIASNVARPIPALAEAAPEQAGLAPWIDLLALDSPYDYDPFWRRCLELGVAVTAHSGSQGWQSRRSISNYNFNHMGHFGHANDAFCKALFMGGVTRRFPQLKFALLEGGVGWAAQLYADLKSHWEKRNIDTLPWLDPSRMDRAELLAAFAAHGGKVSKDREGRIESIVDNMMRHNQDWSLLDEWGPCEITSKEDIHNLFVPNFYFGCEADDPMTTCAFNGAIGTRLNAVFSSDIGHWDVLDVGEVLEEAYEMVEKGFLNEQDFRDFTFTNAVTLHGGMNPSFFAGTSVEAAAAEVLAAGSAAGSGQAAKGSGAGSAAH